MENVIIRPIITEKAMKSSQGGQYSFMVTKTASKGAIKTAVNEMFKVNVINIQTSVLKGKKRRAGAKRLEFELPEWKKAVVRLKKGEKIGIFEPGGEEAQPVKEAKKETKKEKKKKEDK